jgi:putative CocE/NonD family hydrolase
VYGTSYPGFYAAMAALSNHPALKAVSPQAPVTDWFIGDDFHHNGALMVMDAFGFYSGFGKPRPKPTTEGPEGFNFPIQDNYEFFLRNGTLPQLSKLMGDSIAFWNDLMTHPTYSDWWKNRNDRNYVQNISSKIPTLIVGGLFDAEDCWGAWNLYKAIESKAKNKNQLVMGPWFHGQWGTNDGTHLGNINFGSNTSNWYQQNIELPFFNFYLKGKGSIENISEASIFFSGENQWRKFTEWPSSKIEPRDLFLTANGGLSYFTNKMAPLSTFTEYLSDPAKPVPYTEAVHMGRTREYMTDDQRFAARRPDVLVYQTPILNEDLTVAGSASADLMVSISGTDADFVVKIIDVFPDDFKYTDHDTYTMNGYQMLVRGEVMRGKFRNSFETPEAFIPGKPTQVKFALPDMAHTFKKGHRLMIQIQSSWFPLVDRNPQKFTDIYHANANDFQKESIKIFNNQSKIIIPILK